jgi:signal transduction histidine kinase
MVPLLTHAQPVTCLAPTRERGIWFSEDRQVWKCREDGTLATPIQVPEGSVTVLHEDLGGHLWVGALAAGGGRLFRLEGREFRSIQVATPYIRSLSDDCEGNLWVSTRRTGLIQIRQRTVELMTPAADVPSGFSSFCEDIDGRRFAVVNNKLLLFSHASGWAPLQTDAAGPERNFFCVAADPAGGILTSVRTKIFGQERTELIRWRNNDCSSLANTHFNSLTPIIRTLFAGTKGELWLGMQEFGELCRLRDGVFKTFSVPPGNGPVSAMTEDAAGVVWVATVGGLILRVNGDHLVDQTPRLIGAHDAIRSLHTTPDGSLWIGYETRGLGRLLQGRFFLFGQEQGIGDEAFSQIVSDGNGWLWCAGDQGIFRLSRDELDAVATGTASKLHPVLCGRGEGWPVLQAACGNWPQATRSRSGELCMPTGAGLAVIRPGSVCDAPPPAVVIERVSVNGRPVAVYENNKFPARGQASQTADLCGLAGQLSLGQGVRQLGFDYAAVSFSGQEHVRFRYWLEGVDDDWVEAGPQRAAYYSLVSPGHYRFRVSACNNAGIWNEKGNVLAIDVEPFFWQTWWFRLLAWLAVGAAVGGAIFWDIRRRLQAHAAARRQAEGEFKAVWNERNRMARELHDTLAQGLSAISMQLELVKRKLPADSPARSVLEETRQMTKSSLAEARNSIWNMRSQVLETGDLATALEGILKAMPNGCGIEGSIQVTGIPRRLAPVAENNLLRIGQEVIANAVRYARCGRIEVTLEFCERQVALSVRDDGQGFDPEHPPRSEGGFGLSGMRERAEQMHGECHVVSAPGKGTMVRVTVP